MGEDDEEAAFIDQQPTEWMCYSHTRAVKQRLISGGCCCCAPLPVNYWPPHTVRAVTYEKDPRGMQIYHRDQAQGVATPLCAINKDATNLHSCYSIFNYPLVWHNSSLSLLIILNCVVSFKTDYGNRIKMICINLWFKKQQINTMLIYALLCVCEFKFLKEQSVQS